MSSSPNSIMRTQRITRVVMNKGEGLLLCESVGVGWIELVEGGRSGVASSSC